MQRLLVFIQNGNTENILEFLLDVLSLKKFYDMTLCITTMEGVDDSPIIEHIKSNEIPFYRYTHMNKGADLGPFIQQFHLLMNEPGIQPSSFDFFFKIHSKTDRVWRDNLIYSLITHHNYVAKLLCNTSNVGLIGSKDYLMKQDFHSQSHLIKIFRILEIENKYVVDRIWVRLMQRKNKPSYLIDAKKYLFIGGTIWSAKFNIFYRFFQEYNLYHKIYQLLEDGLDYKTKSNGMSETFTHALERFLCIVPSIFNHQIQGTNSTDKQYFLSMLAMFKNEAHILQEWIEHYKWQGVQHFYLINNGSTDEWEKVIQKYQEDGIVTIYNFPEPQSQIKNYNKVFIEVKDKTEWLCIFDLDEFMFGKSTILFNILTQISPNIHQVEAKWMMFGSSGYIQQPSSVRHSFIWRKADPSTLGKSIVRCSEVKELYIHRHNTKNPLILSIDDQVQFNHYAVQSWEFFEQVKIARGDSHYSHNCRTLQYFKEYDFKEVCDKTLANMVSDI